VRERGLVRLEQLINRKVTLPGVKDEHEIDNLVLDPVTGQIAFAVLGKSGWLQQGEDQFMIPWTKLTAAEGGEEGRSFTLKPGESFDPITAPAFTSDRGYISWMVTNEAYDVVGTENQIATMREEPFDQPAPLGMGELDPSWGREGGLVAASRIESAPVLDRSGQEIGEIEALLVDPGPGRVVLAVVESGQGRGWWQKVTGDERLVLVPWRALSLRQGRDGLSVPLDTERIGQMRALEDDDEIGRLSLADAEQVNQDWGLKPGAGR
jgi:sporulation protein YlmC with PRC-barrel domain